MSHLSKDRAVTVAAAQAQNTTGRFYASNVAGTKRCAVEFVVDAIGATPTLTFTIQGLKPGGDEATAADWADIAYLDGDSTAASSKAGIVVTTVGRTVKYLDGLDRRFFDAVGVNVSANTNVAFHVNLYPFPAS